MKSLFFTICLVAAFTFNAQSQKMAAQLQSKKWFVSGTLGTGALTLKTTQGKAANEWEARFSTTGSMANCSTINRDVVDATGTTVKAGTFYCDSFYVYSVKNDLISIMRDDKTHYYKIKALPNSEGIELAPAPKEDFK